MEKDWSNETIFLVNDEGDFVQCDLLFSFENEKKEKVIVYTNNNFDDEGNKLVYANILENGRLRSVDDAKTWEHIKKVMAHMKQYPGALFHMKTRQIYTIYGSECLIGKASSNDIVIDEASIDLQQVKILKKEEEYYIEDLGSLNGTFVEGKRLIPHRITHLNIDTIVKFGDEEFLFTYDDDFDVDMIKDYKKMN